MPRVELHDRFLRLVTADHHADFHLRWLRHHCATRLHPLTGERTRDSSELPDALKASSATFDGDVLEVRWRDDDRVSRYPLAWLHEHAYAVDRPLVPPPPSDVAHVTVACADPARIVERLADVGAVLVRSGGHDPEAETERWIAALERVGLVLVGTHFGRIEDLRTDNTTNANTDQLGYTDAGLELHTDQPFLERPPRYQLLQSIRTATVGGDSMLSDGEAAFRYLASLDHDAASVLLETPVRFHRKQAAFERELVTPLVRLATATTPFHIRASYFTMAPQRLPFERMSAWYRAYDGFMRLLRDPAHQYRFRLEPGDVLLYDNHRMLHGRTAFSGPRWVRGVYFDRA